jgi:hypothetical protein
MVARFYSILSIYLDEIMLEQGKMGNNTWKVSSIPKFLFLSFIKQVQVKVQI